MADYQGNPYVEEMRWLVHKLHEVNDKLCEPHLTNSDRIFYLNLEEKYNIRLEEIKKIMNI